MPSESPAEAPDAAATSRGGLPRLVGRWWFWASFVALVFAFPFVRAAVMAPHVVPPPPVLGHVPAFSLTDQHGHAFGSEDLRGRVWVAGFVFTRCPTICPALTANMKVVQRRSRHIAPAFHLVSFTVDPEHDTPEVLARYAADHGARPARWTFLTGPRDEIRRVAQEGMKVMVGDAPPGATPESIVHGTHLVLVDQALQIRGYFDSNDPQALEELLKHAGLLANRGPRT